MDRQYRIGLFDKVTTLLADFPEAEIENSLISYLLEAYGIESTKGMFYELIAAKSGSIKDIVNIYKMNEFPTDIESIVEFFEYLIEKENKNENGVVFTPKYISDYIVKSSMDDIGVWNPNIKIIDPGCGCGIFLVSAIEFIHGKYEIPIADVLKNNIFGIDILSRNVRRCKTVLRLFCIKNAVYSLDFDMNIIEKNSLDVDWSDAWGLDGFDYIIGNPPYVNTHDMAKETAEFLKNHFNTTKIGVYNIFYAFIEQGYKFLKQDGCLSFIVPNNFMTIKSAHLLREMIRKNKCLHKIIDFTDNMVFRPVRTYNCILTIKKAPQDVFSYCIAAKTDDIESTLQAMDFEQQETDLLDDNGWKLVDKTTLKNIQSIENQDVQLKEFVRTGIATLRDEVYFVNCEYENYYKEADHVKYCIEREIVKPIYKIPELKNCSNHIDVLRHIIFPYRKGDKGFELIEERVLLRDYPNAYAYLRSMKHILDQRDKGKGNPYAWYAYGRTQGLNKYGKKLLFPTFAKNPNFVFVDDELSLFCNGYAVFENDRIDLALLLKILNSKVMEYYVRNTSYPIEGGYYCYQKKYIEKFSLPRLSRDEQNQLLKGDQKFVDEFLMKKYALAI